MTALFLIITLLSHRAAGVFTGGFCLDNVPSNYADTGFAAVSILTEDECSAGGFKWCPLSNMTKDWQGSEFYFFSSCCTGKQGQHLIPDAGDNGWPTCEVGVDAAECTRSMWQTKWMADFMAKDSQSGYNFQVVPSRDLSDPNVYSGVSAADVKCLCQNGNNSAQCMVRKGGKCLVCRTDEPCGASEVQFGINFFKLHTIDLQSSLMSFAAWIRSEWYDSRLDFDYQCYGGSEYFEALAQPGVLDNSVIWAPDIELFNSDEPIWDGSIGARNAMVYSCSSGTPSRAGCGYVYLSRSGLLKALCKFEGIVEFPFDKIQCDLEFAGFGIDGRWQDIIPRKADGGAMWLEKPGSTAIAGLSAGSQFQDYNLIDISVERLVAVYDCCPTAPFPTLIYKIRFKRANDFYVVALVLPAVLLVVVSWVEFWMSPAVGERMNFGISVILSMLMNMVTSGTLMPVCEEKVWMDYMNIVGFLFGTIALVETGIVIHLYQLDDEGWLQAFCPRRLRIRFQHNLQFAVTHITPERKADAHRAAKSVFMHKHVNSEKDGSNLLDRPADEKEIDDHIRKQMYRQIFFELDRSHNMLLDIEEIAEFGQIMTGGNFDKDATAKFMNKFVKNWDGVMDLQEFSMLCDEHLVKTSSVIRFQHITKGFLEICRRKHAARVAMWQHRAVAIDKQAIWAVPLGYVVFLVRLFTASKDTLEKQMTDKAKQMPFYMMGFYPLCIAVVLYSVYGSYRAYQTHKVSMPGVGLAMDNVSSLGGTPTASGQSRFANLVARFSTSTN